MNKALVAAAAVLCLTAGTAHADYVAQWDTTGKTGTETSISGTGSANVTADSLVRGAGLSASSASNNFGSTGWNGVNANDYYQFGISVADGYTVTLDDLYIATRSSATGPGTIGLYTSQDNYTTALYTITQPSAAYVNSVIDLSSLGTLTGAISFRLMEIGDTAPNGGVTASGGTFRAGDYYDGSTAQNIMLTGTTTETPVPTPIPAAAWLMGSGLLGLAGLRRKHA